MESFDRKAGSLWLGLWCLLVLAGGALTAAEEVADVEGRRLGAVDVARVRELYRLSDELGDQVWPGFDVRKIPVAINNDDREELLAGHPDPPPGFRVFEGFELNGRPVMIREEVIRLYGGGGGGTALWIGDVKSVYSPTLQAGDETEEHYLLKLFHEAFHCFQEGYRRRADGAGGEHLWTDPNASAMIALEGHVLRAALEATDDGEMRELVKTFIAVRHERRKGLPKALVLQEGEDEFHEGTAHYAQVRALQLLALKGGIKPPEGNPRPGYPGFADAWELLAEQISDLVGQDGERPMTFERAMYKHGMAQGVLLDRLRPGWKEALREQGATQFALLEGALDVPADEEAKRVTAAKERFGYQDLFAEQKRRTQRYHDMIRGFLEAPGRRYRIYDRDLPGRGLRKSRHPLHPVPEDLGIQAAAKAEPGSAIFAVYEAGVARYEKPGFSFSSQEVPILLGMAYMEWIDPDPAPDRSDLKIVAERQEGDVYHGLKLTTRGFTLEAAKARIEWSQEVVEIHLMPPG